MLSLASLVPITLWLAFCQVPHGDLPKEDQGATLFAPENLVAWCVVPFDAAQRGPQDRAAMLRRLGFTQLAYDWRDQHVAEFEAELLACRKHGINLFAFWDEHEAMFELLGKYQLRPQIWKMLPQPHSESQTERVIEVATNLLPLVERTRQLGCKLGIYNHGGWTGEPENMVAVCEWLRSHQDAAHVGIVYNFHHAHARINQFAQDLERMRSYLLCVNINGMNAQAAPKIETLGQGEFERGMLKALAQSGYLGPIGILDHREQLDAEVSLKANLDGLHALRGEGFE